MRAILLIAALHLLVPAQPPRPSRQEIAAMERAMDQRFARMDLERPVEVLGLTRGLYVDGFGAVFTAEINLLPAPGLSPFRPSISREEAVRVREQKLRRLPQIRELMRDMLLAAAQSLDRLPPGEQIVLGVLLYSHSWEDTAGLPRLIQMQGRRDALLDVALQRQPRAALAQIIRAKEE
ncbi:MAG: hypothetical protein N2036_04705 [Bryobacteraceae bacterium]|nr:hypothetical protein [Bryobacteraceae bacterium]MCX7603359.1 hypothetical protein [Bryobacteraceae bacterium]